MKKFQLVGGLCVSQTFRSIFHQVSYIHKYVYMCIKIYIYLRNPYQIKEGSYYSNFYKRGQERERGGWGSEPPDTFVKVLTAKFFFSFLEKIDNEFNNSIYLMPKGNDGSPQTNPLGIQIQRFIIHPSPLDRSVNYRNFFFFSSVISLQVVGRPGCLIGVLNN